MPRPLRITAPNLPFHIVDRGNNKQAIFKESKDFFYFLQLLERYKKELEFNLYHLCLMPNHIHLMIEPTTEGSLSKAMMRLTLAYSSYFNQKNKGVGHVWQGRYKSSLIGGEDYFITCALYTELNPVRAKMVSHPQDYQWSSYNLYAFGQAHKLIENIIDFDPYYLKLGESDSARQKQYRENISKVMKQDILKNIRTQLYQGVYGQEDFVREMKKKFKIGSLRKVGRPRKRKMEAEEIN